MALEDYRTVLVTGASSGIGAALVPRLCARGLEVHAVARRKDRLDQLAKETGCHAHALDITDKDAMARLCDGLEVDVLVNNAGITAGYKKLHEAEPEDLERMIAVNLTAVVSLVRTVLPGMVARNRGHIVNVGSLAAQNPVTGVVGYGATKGGIHSFSRSLRMDLVGHHIRVTEVAPSRVRTEIHGLALGDEALAEELLFRGYEVLEPEDLADAILYALDAPARVNVGLIELTPTMQVMGGFQFAREGQNEEVGGSTGLRP